MKINVKENERVFVLVNNKAVKYLGPGVHRVREPLFAEVSVERVNTATLTVDLSADRLALVPEEDLRLLSVARGERVLVRSNGRVSFWYGLGNWQVWTVLRGVDRKTGAQIPLITFERFDTSGVEAPLLDPDVLGVASKSSLVEVTAPEGSVAVRYVNGRLDKVLPAGRHAAWITERPVRFEIVDVRERVVAVNGQEVMTKDRVSLRLNVAASFKVVDVARMLIQVRSADEALYLAVQLAAREVVTSRTLDELLASREQLTQAMLPSVRERAVALGLELVELGVKDVILPGEMKELLNKVIQASKQAEANVILRREETAATRSLAQTAKLLQDNPLLLRLKELESYQELAAKVGRLHVTVGESALAKLQLKE